MKDRPIILLIEDEHQQRESLVGMFESEGYDTVGVESAETALEQIARRLPDLIITDVKLTGMDGFTFFDAVREDPRWNAIPFIFITGYNDPAAIEHVKRLGALGYVTKPYDLENLISLVKRSLPVS